MEDNILGVITAISSISSIYPIIMVIAIANISLFVYFARKITRKNKEIKRLNNKIIKFYKDD